MNFEKQIINLIESSQTAWNESNLEHFSDFFEPDIRITMEPVTVAGVHFKEQNIKGLEDAMKFVRKYRHVLPLKYHAEYHEVKLSKHLIYKKYFYQLKIRAQFDCKISEYGKYKEFHISGYENAESKKITAFYLLKNIIEHKLKSLFRHRQTAST